MPVLSLVIAPDPIFKQKALPVEKVDAEVQQLVDDLFATLEFERAFGLAATMVGVPKRIAVVNLREEGSEPFCLINPEITWKSDETQTIEEASLCFPGIGADITRPKAITLRYLDREGKAQTLEAEGFLATVIQHEMDYMDGRTYLDTLSKMKRDMLMRKMQKFIRQHPPHVHGEHCNH